MLARRVLTLVLALGLAGAALAGPAAAAASPPRLDTSPRHVAPMHPTAKHPAAKHPAAKHPAGTRARHPRHLTPSQRIVRLARRYVGHARYVEGGNTPRHGFDCSGYTQWVYAKAGIAHLPHNAQAQRHARRMHRISARRARPGDLIFYLQGRYAFHVAIYLGHHRQLAAANPRDDVLNEQVWSRHVVYGTDWH